jgi:cell division protein FtsZ
MKDSGLSSLFRGTEAARQAEELPLEPDAPAEDVRVPSVAGAAAADAAEDALEAAADEDGGLVGDEAAVSAGDEREVPPRTDEGRRTLIQPSYSFPAVIRVVGVGGAGTNAINRMLEAGLEGVEFIAINTDTQALAMCEADHKLRIGEDLTKGLGGGSDPRIGRDAAIAAYDQIKDVLKGSDMVFITAGEGGGTGTGAAPVVAEIARSLGALTIGVVTRPFSFEGRRRGMQALEGARALKQRADTVIVVPNDKLLQVAERRTTMIEALRLADDVLRQGVQGICDLVTVPGLINLDLADVRTIMTGAGTAHMGIGHARGEGRGQKAAEMALNSSLLETSIDGARGILLNISGGRDLSLHEITEVAEAVSAAADPEANIIFGAVVDESLGDALWVTVVATGFDATSEEVLVAQVQSATRHDHSGESKAPSVTDGAPQTGPAGAKEAGGKAEAPATSVPAGAVPAGGGLEPTPRTFSEPVKNVGPGDDTLEVPSFLR